MAGCSRILVVDRNGHVNKEDLDSYITLRRQEVGRRLQMCLDNSSIARRWFDELSEMDLCEEKDGEVKYVGDANAEGDARAALAKVKSTANAVEMVSSVEDLVLSFCGFNCMKPSKATCIVNALHFQYDVDVNRFLNASLSLPSDEGAPTDAEKALFDEAKIGGAELLLRCVVETSDGGGLLANPFSPGMPMGKLLKLPLFAQLVMVLTNAVEAVWYQEAVPTCPMGINVYASLLVAEAPVLQMVAGVSVVEIMEMTKGARRGPEVDQWVDRIRETGASVVLDDFDAKHPGIDSKPDGIKVCVFTNAFHSLQTFKNEPVGDSSAPLLPITEMPYLEKEKVNAFDVVDFYGSLVPKHQKGTRVLIMEGSENCLKSEIQGPPLNFAEPRATIASAHVYQAAARTLCANLPEGESLQMLHQGGRALYDDEKFDEDACGVIKASGKQMAAARTGDAGTIAWIGSEAVRRAAMQHRPLVCGVAKSSPAASCHPPVAKRHCAASVQACSPAAPCLQPSSKVPQIVAKDSVANMAEFFPALSALRSGTQLSPDVVHRAKEHCKGGQSVANIQELYQWMLHVNPEMPFFDTRIAVGAYPAALAAFVAHCTWEPWKVHAVYAMHGEIYLSRLKAAKPMMDQKSYRDHFAGASMHRANGLIHMARSGAEAGHEHLLIPCWDTPLPLDDITTQGVADMRTACTLRSEKYGEKGCSDGAVKAYQAALRNLADALEVHQTVVKIPGANTDRMVLSVRERATNLSLTNSKMLAACSAGDALAAHEQASVARDVRLGDGAVHAIARREQPEAELGGNCVQCGTNVATHRGFSCRCLCLCEGCVAAAGVRVIECPVCDDFTEFVRA